MKWTLVALLAGTLASCAGPKPDAETTTTADNIYDLAASAKDSTVAGTDADNNSIRDDIEAQLNREYSGTQLQTVLHTAKGYQEFIAGDIHNRTAMIEKANAFGDNLRCLLRVMPLGDVKRTNSKIKRYTLNTEQRLDAFEQGNSIISGAVFTHENPSC